MKAFTFIQQQMSARIFATLTILSLLLSAFPAAFFIAEAASTGVSVNHSTLTTEINQQVNFKVSTILDNASTTDNTYILLSDDGGGDFYNGNTDGDCNDTTPETDKTFAIEKNKGVCYGNDIAGVYTITVQLIEGGAGPAIGNPATVEITVNEPKPSVPSVVYGCMDDAATNYDSAATNQGEVLCEYPSTPNVPEPVYGCMDQEASNYNPAATVNIPERCTYPEPPKCVNLLENGSFEQPVVTNLSKWQKFATVSGWVIGKVVDSTPTTLELHRDWTDNEAADGEQYAELDGDLSSNISQTVVTIPDATYELSWAFAPRHDISAEQNQLSVLIDGIQVDSNGPATGLAGLIKSDWTKNSFTFTANDAAAEITFADAGPSNSFGTFLDDAQLCLVKEPEPEVNIEATKIVCEDESLLPNWAVGAPKIDADTVSDFLSSSVARAEGCHVETGWEFEWAPKNTADPGDTLVGTAGPNWNTFSSSTTIPLSLVEGGSFWMREVLQSGYIPFTHEKEGNKNTDDVTAEFYCHTDGLNYDNFDRIDSPKANETYYCVAWNVPTPPASCKVVIKSDDTNAVVEKDNESAKILTFVHPNWVKSLESAKWIWGDDGVIDSTVDETQTFINKFGWGGSLSPLSATLKIAADNSFSASLNETLAAEDLTEFNFGATKSYDVTSLIQSGNNELAVKVKNFALANSLSTTNPAGLYYELTIEGVGDDCDIPYEPEPVDEVSDVTMCKYDNYENRLSGWQLSLTGTTSNQVSFKTVEMMPAYVGTTTENGCVVFEDVPYGNYVVGETLQTGWENQYGLGAVVVDEETEQFNVMNRQIPPPETYVIDGYKYEVVGTSTVPRAGWEIRLEDGEGGLIATTTTNANGYYSFEVEDGYYKVKEVMKTDWEQVEVEQNGYNPESEENAYCAFEVYNSEYSRYSSEYYEGDDYQCDFYNKFVGIDEPEEPEEPAPKRRGGGSGTKVKKPAPQVLGASTTNFCPLITDYMQIGWNNDPLEVMKLQMFLNMFKDTFGGVTNPITGEFETVTDANVKAFQEKYRSEVLDPWFNKGIVPHNQPTGFVYKTTLWKINSIVCPDYAVTPDFAGENLSSNTDID